MQADTITWNQKTFAFAQFVAAGVAAAWGGFPPIYQTLMILMGIDLLTAWVRSMIRGDFSPLLLKIGLLKKVATALAVGVAHVLEVRMGIPIATGVAAAFILAEAASAWRNLSQAGIRLPQAVTRLLQSLRKEVDNDLKAQTDRRRKKALAKERDQP